MQWLINIIKDTILPPGSIICWHGTWGTIPDGWKPCDGNNGTPDLRGRFIFGAGDGDALHATGGSRTTHLDPGSGIGTGKAVTNIAQNMPPYKVMWWIMKV